MAFHSALAPVVNGIVLSMSPILQIMVLLLIAMFVWAVIGVHLYAGAFHYACVAEHNQLDLLYNHTTTDAPLTLNKSTHQMQACSDKTTNHMAYCPNGTVCKHAWDGMHVCK